MNEFDVFSHIFSVLPLSLTYVYNMPLLFYLTFVVVLVSVCHHSYPTNVYLEHVDEFFASSLIFVSFFVYVETSYVLAFVSVFCLLFVIPLDFIVHADLVTIFAGFVLFVSVCLFVYQMEILRLDGRVYNIRDPYFISFVVTQMLSIGFYLWGAIDEEQRYAHSFWHLFAFVSFGSLVAHVADEADENMNRVLFYLCGSLPSRLFISWVFIDWGETGWESRIPVFLTFVALTIPVVMRKPWVGVSLVINALYVVLDAFILFGRMRVAGWLLLSSTLLSAWHWGHGERKSSSVVPNNTRGSASVVSVPPVGVELKKINIRL